MVQFSIQQKLTIDNYRQHNNLGFVLSDEAVVELIKKEMEAKGTVYTGFETLATSVVKTKNTQKNSNIFGIEYVKDKNAGFTIEENTVTSTTVQPTPSQTKAIEFLSSICSEAETVFKEREDEAGAISAIVNTWKEIFDKEYAKSTVNKEIQALEEELKVLDKASKGELTTRDILGNVRTKTFEETFLQRRGVKFNEENISDCAQKAQQFAEIKSSVDMINQLKELLGTTTCGNIQSQLNPQKSSATILKAFQMSGINSINEMNKTLKDIEEKYQNHPDMQKYGTGLKFAKNKQGKYLVYRTAQNGYPAEATNEQLKFIAKEMEQRLDKALADALGVEYDENATSEQIQELTQQTFEKYQAEYEESFQKAYGKKDVKALAEAYVEKQQQGVANVEIGLNILSMALMIVPGGAVAGSNALLRGTLVAKNAANGAKIVKGLQLVNKGAQAFQKVSQAVSPVIMANMTLRPTELLEQLTSKNGMSAEEWEYWGIGVLQNTVYMTAGMGASKLAEVGAAMYKTKALVSTLKSTGKSGNEIIALIKANPVKFPNEIVKSLTKVDKLAKTLQISSEVALDLSNTVLLNKAMGNGDLLPMDVINSIAFAISGGVIQKQFLHLSTESKVMFIQETFKDYGITRADAQNILKTMDNISAGKDKKFRAKKEEAQDFYNKNLSNIPLYKEMFNKNIVTAEDVKKLLPNKMIEENFYIESIHRLINEIPTEVKNDPNFRTIDLSPQLTEKDFEIIAQLINLHKNKHLAKWFEYNPKYGIKNIQNLAIFARVVDFTNQHKDFLEFNANQWDIVIEGILKKPENLVDSILRYKYNSTEINKALDTGIYPNKEIKELINNIKEYISLFDTKEEITVYRGEGGYGILNTGKNSELGEIVKKFTEEYKTGKYSEEEKENFIEKYLAFETLKQKRFLSTSMTPEGSKEHQGVIYWEELVIPKGTQGAFIEGFCVDKPKEAEFLIQSDTEILITHARFENGMWILRGVIKQ